MKNETFKAQGSFSTLGPILSFTFDILSFTFDNKRMHFIKKEKVLEPWAFVLKERRL